MTSMPPQGSRPLSPRAPLYRPGSPAQIGANRPQASGSFQDLFSQELGRKAPVTFSKHAEQRLETRNIRLTSGELEAISAAVNRAAEKGIRDSLILMKDMAFIVNVPGRVVVTAMSGETARENVFTNIDGAVVL